VEGGLFFANVEPVRAAVRRHATDPGVHAIVLDAETIPFVDVSAVGMLGELARQLEADGVHLLLAGDIGQVRDVLRRAGGGELPEAYPTVAEAVQTARTTQRKPR
jgi:anti-anti-sigma factor